MADRPTDVIKYMTPLIEQSEATGAQATMRLDDFFGNVTSNPSVDAQPSINAQTETTPKDRTP